MHIYFGNKTAISIAHNLVLQDKTKHIRVHKHFIKEKTNEWVICIPYLPTIEQIADVLSKDFEKWQFNKLIDKLVMIDIFRPAWEGALIFSFSVLYFIVNLFFPTL